MAEKLAELSSLKGKQKIFVQEYLVDLNATQAAIRAGYSPKTAQQQSSRLLLNVVVKQAIDQAIAERSKRARKSADEVLEELENLAFLNMADFIRISSEGEPIVDMGQTTRAHQSGLADVETHDYLDGRGEDARDVRRVRIKLNAAGKMTALVKLAEHHGLLKPQAMNAQDNSQHLYLLAKDDPLRENALRAMDRAVKDKKLLAKG